MGATEGTVLAGVAMVLTAEGANHILPVPTGLKDSLSALVLGGEVVGEFKYGVEAGEVNHKAQVLRFLYYLYLKLGLFFQKIQSFFAIVQRFIAGLGVNRYIVPKKKQAYKYSGHIKMANRLMFLQVV